MLSQVDIALLNLITAEEAGYVPLLGEEWPFVLTYYYSWSGPHMSCVPTPELPITVC